MNVKCPRCDTDNSRTARFCSRCGRRLPSGGSAGRVLHPSPLAAPDGFEACHAAVGLWYRWVAAYGGSPLSSTESLGLVLFNGGYGLESVVICIRGLDAEGDEVFSVEPDVPRLPRGREVTVDVPSYELPAPARQLDVTLVSAEYEGQE